MVLGVTDTSRPGDQGRLPAPALDHWPLALPGTGLGQATPPQAAASLPLSTRKGGVGGRDMHGKLSKKSGSPGQTQGLDIDLLKFKEYICVLLPMIWCVVLGLGDTYILRKNDKKI